MSMVIRSNIPAMNTHRNLGASQSQLSGALQKLSSGYRINSGKDAPADLVISEQLRAQFTGLSRAVRNTTEANNVLSIAEGALNEMNNILKKMKSLAIHAASDGVTSPDQIEADQAELDSGIKTIQRIADTTKYVDQMLLNGNKELTYSVQTTVVGYQNNKLVDESLSNVEQVQKRSASINIGFTGSANADRATAVGDTDFTKQAMKAYMEIDPIAGGISQVDPETGKTTQAQKFILTGSKGSKAFSYAAGTELFKIVEDIKDSAGSTGIDASLTFNSNQEINRGSAISDPDALFNASVNGTAGGNSAAGVGAERAMTDIGVFENIGTDTNGNKYQKITEIDTAPTSDTGAIVFGQQTDGHGRMFIKITGDNSYEVYKDESLSAESLIGVGTNGQEVLARNNSGLAGLELTVNANARYGDVAVISVGNISLENDTNEDIPDRTITSHGVMDGEDGVANTFNLNGGASIASGVQLGVNTDKEGSIHFKVEFNNAGRATVYAYNSADMSADSLVAKSEDNLDLSSDGSVVLNAIWNNDHTANTGLALHLNHNGFDAANRDALTGSISFNNLGARISSTEYGSDSFIQIRQQEGGLFTYYDQADSADSAKVVEKGKTHRLTGQDATVNVNGSSVTTKGLDLNISTTSVQAKIKLNAGRAGSTTVAQVGYNEGSIFTRNQALTIGSEAEVNDISGRINNAGHVTNESLSNFEGGMQLQLGESSGEQDRTVISLQNMAVSMLGRIKHTAVFDAGKAVVETRELSLEDIQSGKIASLSTNAVLAMSIIEQATTDVSNLRAQIGAVQSNMLETNKNNLEVAVEKITDTESDIRNTDMASEMTNFTQSQVLQNAGINMLAQANQSAQSVLSLLG